MMNYQLLSPLFIAIYLLLFYKPVFPTFSLPTNDEKPIPNIVHQTYDYQSPNFFLFLSLLCVQKFIKPKLHILWVNDEGRYRKGHWDGWQRNLKIGTWEYEMHQYIRNKSIEVTFFTFPGHPIGKPELIATNKAHRSDFARMKILTQMGGIYLDTDTFAIQSVTELLQHDFVLAFDNIVDLDPQKPKRLNNGILFSAPNATFLQLWIQEYQHYNPNSFDYDSSVVPLKLAYLYPDLVHIEMFRISPISYGFQTSLFAEAITCGLFLPPTTGSRSKTTGYENIQLHGLNGGIWYPNYHHETKQYSFLNTTIDTYLFQQLSKKLILHLTMSQVRGLCMLRKQLGNPNDLQHLPSFLGHIFRIAYYGIDHYDYTNSTLLSSSEEKLQMWQKCRNLLGMYNVPDKDDKSRQQYTKIS
jgi:hypothetical protein